MFIPAYKKIGETPLQCLEKYRSLNSISCDVSMTYAGRLDPLAHGLLPILTDRLAHKKQWFTSLDKTYQVRVLVGVSSDTYDIFGIPCVSNGLLNSTSHEEKTDQYKNNEIENQALACEGDFMEGLESSIKKYIGWQEQLYPPFSSKPVNGIPLWQYARDGRMAEIKDMIPKHTVLISSIKFLDSANEKKVIHLKDILEKLKKVISKTKESGHNFRQEEIEKAWEKIAELKNSFRVVTLEISCGGGAYIRQLVHDLGKETNTHLCVYDLKRTRVGPFVIKE